MPKGPASCLSLNEEDSIVKWLEDTSKRGLFQGFLGLRQAGRHIAEKFPGKKWFSFNLPTHAWARKFLSRNKNIKSARLSVMHPKSVSDLIESWKQTNQYLEDNHILEILKDPSRVANCDDCLFEMDRDEVSQIVIPSKDIVKRLGVTVMHTIIADGSYLTPFLILPYKEVPKTVATNMPPEIEYNYHVDPQMTPEDFRYYIEFVFYQQMQSRGVQFPVILFINKPTNFVSFEVSNICKKLQIHVVCMFPEIGPVIHPMDCTVFHQLKQKWSRLLSDDKSKKITAENFGCTLLKFLSKFQEPDWITEGFKVTGIYPWHSDNIDIQAIFRRCNRRSESLGTTLVLPSHLLDVLKSRKENLNETTTQLTPELDTQSLDSGDLESFFDEPTNPNETFEKENQQVLKIDNNVQIMVVGENHKTYKEKVFEELKILYGPQFKKYTDTQLKPQTIDEFTLRRILLHFWPENKELRCFEQEQE